MRAIAEDRKRAEERRRLAREKLEHRAAGLREVEVTIAAAANEDGILYGSVGPREIAAALQAEGHDVDPPNGDLHDPIRRLDNLAVRVKFADDIDATVKVWVVRSQASEDEEASDEGDD